MKIEYSILILGFALGIITYYFFDILVDKIKMKLIERRDKARRQKPFIKTKYSIGSSAFYGSELVPITGLRIDRENITAFKAPEVFYIIKDSEGVDIYDVPESELSDKPTKGRII